MDNKKDELIKKILGNLRQTEEPKEMTLEERMLAVMRKRKEEEAKDEEATMDAEIVKEGPNIAPGSYKQPSLLRTRKPAKVVR